MKTGASPVSASFAQSQSAVAQWISNNSFSYMLPQYYRHFYENLMREWLQWYDGYVPIIHCLDSGIMSTKIGATIVNRSTDAICNGGFMFQNENVPKLVDEKGVSVSMHFVSDSWAKQAKMGRNIKKAIRLALAGGTSLIKLNPTTKNGLWLDVYRSDRFYCDFSFNGRLTHVKTFLNNYQKTVGEVTNAFMLVEERYYKSLTLSTVPVSVYKVYRMSTLTLNDIRPTSECDWKDIPRQIRDSLKEDYPGIIIGQEQALPFSDLGAYALTNTDGIDNIAGLMYGKSILSDIMPYLFSYDYYYSCLNTDMYLGRGRVIVKKYMKNPNNPNAANMNSGLDGFAYESVDSLNTDEQKPIPIQFDLRSQDWTAIRNILIESMAFSLGISVSTLASFLNDQSARTAREISSEESATTSFVESKRDQFQDSINDMLKTVCQFYGMEDIISIRWAMSGQTNMGVLSERITREYQGGLRSLDNAVRAINPDFDEYQAREEIQKIKSDNAEKQTMASNSLFGDIDLNGGDNGSEIYNAEKGA